MAFDLELGAVAVLWLVCLYRLPTLARSPRQRSFTLMLLALTASATINESRVTAIVDRVADVANISVLLKNLLGILATMAAMRFADSVAQDDRPSTRHRRIWANTTLVAAMLAMIALFTIIPRHEGGPDFVDAQSANPAAGAYGVLFQLCIGVTLVWISVAYWRYWRVTDSKALRTTLLLFNFGLAVGAVYVLNRLVFLISHLAGSQLVQGPVYVAVSTTLFAVALLLLAVGSVAYGCRALGQQLARYVALHRLYPLWRHLQQAVPEVVLGPAPTRLTDLFALSGLRLRLYRRTIEIRDAQWVLRNHVSAADRNRLRAAVDARGLGDPVFEASLLAAGRRAKLAGEPPTEGSPETAGRVGADVDSEARALVRLAHRLRSDEVIAIVNDSINAVLP